MAELLRLYPGAQRALFARYHIGGLPELRFPADGDACRRVRPQ